MEIRKIYIFWNNTTRQYRAWLLPLPSSSHILPSSTTHTPPIYMHITNIPAPTFHKLCKDGSIFGQVRSGRFAVSQSVALSESQSTHATLDQTRPDQTRPDIRIRGKNLVYFLSGQRVVSTFEAPHTICAILISILGFFSRSEC